MIFLFREVFFSKLFMVLEFVSEYLIVDIKSCMKFFFFFFNISENFEFMRQQFANISENL